MTSDPTILRLRRANPVRDSLPAGEAALFAEITAQPGDPRLSAARRPHRRRAAVLVLSVVAAAVLASAAYAVSQWVIDDNVVEPPVTRQEYADAQKVIPLPPGAKWPGFRVDDNSVTTRGGGSGAAVLQAMTAWECYWTDAIRTGDSAAADRSRGMLESFLASNVFEAPSGAPEGWTPSPLPAVPFVVFAHDGGLDHLRGAYRQAAAGDAREIGQYCRANS